HQISSNLTNRALFIAFTTLIGSNIYLFALLLIQYSYLNVLNRITLMSILGTQFIIAISTITPLIRITSSLHCHRYWLVRLQSTLKDKLVLNKLKVASLYEQLNSKQKIGFSIGPLGEVSWKVVFEVGGEMVCCRTIFLMY